MTISRESGKERALNIESITWGELTWINIEQPTELEIDYSGISHVVTSRVPEFPGAHVLFRCS